MPNYNYTDDWGQAYFGWENDLTGSTYLGDDQGQSYSEWEIWLNKDYTGRTYSGDALNEKGNVIDVPRYSEDYISNKAIHEPQIKIPKKSQIGITLLGLFIVSKVL